MTKVQIAGCAGFIGSHLVEPISAKIDCMGASVDRHADRLATA
jgi:nucleoside-diphosphate-sugar epimerase